MSIQSKAEQLAQTLKERILSGEYPLNSYLPSTSLLCEGFGVSKTTARQAVELLKAEGLVCGHHGLGVQIIRRTCAPPRRKAQRLPVLFVLEYTLWDNPFFYWLIASFQQFYGTRIQIRTQFIFSTKLNEEILPADELILLAGRFPEEMLNTFIAAHPKTILLNWALEGVNYVAPDERLAGQYAAQALVEAGKKRIGLLNITYHYYLSKASGDEFDLRLKGIRNYLHTLPNPPSYIDIAADDWDWLEPGDKVIARLLEKSNGVDALISPFDRLAVNLLDALHRHNIKVPQQIALISFDDNFFSQFCHPALTTVAPQMSDYMQKLWKGIHAVSQGKSYQKTVKPVIVSRDSL